MNKFFRQACFALFLLLVAIILVYHIISDQRRADSNRRLIQQNAVLQWSIDSLTEQIQQDKARISNLERQIKDKQTVSRGGERPELLGTYTVTAYCSCEICCGKRDRSGGKVIGAAGVELTPGISVASPLPFGTELMINGHKYVVQDRTAGWIVDRYDGRIIDIYFASHEAALTFGKQVCEVYKVD